MGRAATRFAAIAIVAAEVAALGLAATSASADGAQERREIKRQQQIIIEQQRQILDNQRQLEAQKRQLATAPVDAVGQPIDERKLPKGLLSGILPACPLGFAYNPFTGCVLYVAH